MVLNNIKKLIFELMKLLLRSQVLILMFLLTVSATAQNLSVIDTFAEFESKYLQNKSEDTIYVYNFWATWCKPCVKELPYFDSLNFYKGDLPVKLVLVSLDFEEQIETVLKPFLINENISNEIVVLTDGNVNSWIDKIDTLWSGAIPGTLVLNGSKKIFYEKTYHSYNDLLISILKIIL